MNEEKEKQKFYLLGVTDYAKEALERLIPGLFFVIAEAFPLTDNPKYQVLVNRVPEKPEEAQTTEVVEENDERA